jgi:hypothetical protein
MAIPFLPPGDDVPDGMKLIVLPQQMIAAEELRIDIPYSHRLFPVRLPPG